MAAGPPEVLEKDLGCPEATDKLPGQAGSAQRRPRNDRRKDADTELSSDGESAGAHGLEETRTRPGVSEQDPDKPELSMPEPAPLGVDKKVAEKKRTEKVGAKGSTTGPPVPKSLPVQRKVEPSSLDPAEEPLLWEGLTLNKCILVASIVALLSVTFQVLQAPCSKDRVSHGPQEPPPPPLHEPPPEVVSAKEEEEAQEVVTTQPPQPESSTVKDDDDDDGDDYGDGDDEADSNLAEPWIFKKWFGRSAPKDEDEEPTDIPEVPPVAVEVRKSQEKKLEEKEEKKEEKEEKKEEKKQEKKEEKKEEKKQEKKEEKKEEKVREGRVTQAERSSRREARAKDRAPGDKSGRASRAPREPEQHPQRKRGREGKDSRRERDEPRKEGWKGRASRGNGESPKRDWRQQKGRRPWESMASPGKDGTTRPREGRRRD